MATFNQLLLAYGDAQALNADLRVAIALAAEQIRLEVDTTRNHANRLKWAKKAMTSPDSVLEGVRWCVLAQKKDLTAVQIRQLSDADLIAAVLACVDLFADGS